MTAADRTSVILVDSQEQFVTGLTPLLPAAEFEVSSAADAKAAKARVAQGGTATVVVTGPSVPLESAMELARALTVTGACASVVAVMPSADTAAMRAAMRAGVSDLLVAGEHTWAEVAAAVRDAAAALEGNPCSSDEAYARRAQVVAVMGTKGGVGKSVLATNLAAAAAGAGKDVVLVDLDLASGDTGIMLSLEPTRTIHDAAAVSDRLDAPMLEGFLSKHRSGARVLLAPARPEDADIVTASRVARVLTLLADMADLVIVDTPSAWTEATLAAADASDRILAVTCMDVPSIKDTSVMLSRLEALGRVNGQVRVVLNRADSKVLIDEKDVEKALGRAVSVRVPSDRAVPRSVNKGVPLVLESPRSAVSRAINDLAKNLCESEVPR